MSIETGSFAHLSSNDINRLALDLIDNHVLDMYEYVSLESHETLVGMFGEIAGMVKLAKQCENFIDGIDKRNADMLSRFLFPTDSEEVVDGS